MKVNGWTWDEKMGRWFVLKGTTMIVVRLPKHDPPENPADLFSVQTRGAQGIQIGDGGTQINSFTERP